jgi:S-DNA-T family DNA segregation ATPase FtsK/SpoIIIE
VTLYEVVPDRGVKIHRIKSLENDIALSLSALGIRIIAPIPGRGTVGIEVPNKKAEIVSMKGLLSSQAFLDSKFELPLALGRTITNDPYIIDLTRMPHLLVAGATGQGKSVGLNAIITSLLYKKHPAELKLVLIDPKRVELPLYAKIERHFLAKLPGDEDAIITDTKKVINTLNSLCILMDHRLELLKMSQTRNIKEYNDKFIARRLNPEKGHEYMPYIVLIIDEFADLIMTAGREIESPIGRLAQLSRAIGIHLIISTQRPSANIITGFIKANFPSRIAFRVFSGVDSRTILDSSGADRLVGRGDMLISQGGEPVRVQCAFIDTPEIEVLTDYIGSQQGYPEALHLPEYVGDDDSDNGSREVDLKKRDPLFDEAARLVVTHQQGSTSLIQRRMQLGYNRAGRIIDQLEAAGIVGQFEGSKARDVVVQDMSTLEQILKRLNEETN